MARPSKSTNVLSSKLSKADRQARLEAEEKLKGYNDKIKPSNRLNANQKKVFSYIVDELEASEILGNLDVFILETISIAIDRLQAIEKEINRDFTLIYSKELMSAKDKYTKDLFKCCQELSLSPQSRAKMGIITANKQTNDEDPLLTILKGGKHEATNTKN